MTTSRRIFLAAAATTAALPLLPGEAAAEPLPKHWTTESSDLRTFSGTYTTGHKKGYHIDVQGWEFYRRYGRVGYYAYQVQGRNGPLEVWSPRPLQDTEVFDGIFKELVQRAAAMGRPKLASEGIHWPVWLFRTSVLDYSIECRTGYPMGSRTLLGTHHTSEDLDGLVKVGKVGPVV